MANWTLGKRKLPVYVVLLSLIAATGGLMFGYDVGISGGLYVMDDFLQQFFPRILAEKNKKNDDSTASLYCLYGNQTLQFFTSSLYLAAMVATFFAAIVSTRYGRKVTMLMAGIFFDVCVVLNIIAGCLHGTQASLTTLICGRIILGFGVGFGNQVLVGIFLIGTGEDHQLPQWRAKVVMFLVCVFVCAFAWSWGTLGWLISTEIFPLVCRSEGQSVTVFFNMLFTFLIAQTTLTMLCYMKFAIFFFFAGWSVVMGALTYFFLPETMNMEIEFMGTIWSYHWFWKRFVTDEQHDSIAIHHHT